MAEEQTPSPAQEPVSETGASAEAKPAAAKAKKEKGPVVEDKPFAEFIQQDYLPALEKAFAKQGVAGWELSLVKQSIPIRGFDPSFNCSQVVGTLGPRKFNIYFLEDNIQGQRAFSYSATGTKTSTVEPFLCDEKKITLDLLVFGAMQRLNGQKWLARN
jgi:hypothetical protein